MSLMITVCSFGFPTSVNAADNTTTVTNTFHTGNVDIELSSVTHNENGTLVNSDSSQEVLTGSNGELLGPNSDIDRQMTVNNIADNAWVRARLDITSKDLDYDHIHSLEVDIPDKNWKLCKDGWYYYTKPLKHSENVVFYDNIHIPSSWTNDVADKSFRISVDANAVQEKNFNPDFDAQDPWKGTPIQDTVRSDEQRVKEEETTGQKEFIKIVYENNAEQYVKVPNNFSEGIGKMMPGDVIAKSIDIVNKSDHPEAIYFRAENPMDRDLANAIQIKLKMGDRLLYSGPLSGLTSEREIINLDKGKSERLYITIEIPISLDNRYEATDIATIWHFRAKDIDVWHMLRNVTNVQTGVSTDAVMYIGIGATAVVLLIILLIVKNRKKKFTEDKQ